MSSEIKDVLVICTESVEPYDDPLIIVINTSGGKRLFILTTHVCTQ